MSWGYLDGETGTPLLTPPRFITSVEVSLSLGVTSGPLPRDTTAYTFDSAGLPRDATLKISYRDTLGNQYRLTFSELKP